MARRNNVAGVNAQPGRGRSLWQGVVGIAQATAALALVALVLGRAAALAGSIGEWQRPLAVTACLAAVAGLAGLFLLCWNWSEGKGNRAYYAIFFGVLPTWAALTVAGCGLWLSPSERQSDDETPVGVKVLKIVVDCSDVVLFPDENGERIGPAVTQNNALAAVIDAICQHVEQKGVSQAAPPRLDFWAWLGKHWRVLVDWRPAPGPNSPIDPLTRCEFYLFDGERCARFGKGKKPSEAFRQAMSNGDPLASRPTGLPAKEMMQALGLPAGDDTAVLLLTAADVNSAAEGADWQAGFDPGSARVISVLLPSLPRSGYQALRGARGKADLLRVRPGAKVVWLAGPSRGALASDLPIDLFSDLPDLACEDTVAWDEPQDLDERRREVFGIKQVVNMNCAVARGKLLSLDTLIPTPAPLPPRQPAEWLAVALLALGVFACAVGGMALVAPRTIGLTIDVPRPGRLERGACLAEGLVGLLAVVWAVHHFWPGEHWQQNGRPALAVWTYVAVWSAWFLYPLLVRLECGAPVGLALAVAVALPAAVGLFASDPGSWGLAALLPVMLVGLSCLLASEEDRRYTGSNKSSEVKAEEHLWALAPRWCPLATVVAIWTAVLAIGAIPAAGDETDHLARVLLFGAAVLGLVILLGLIALITRGVRRVFF